MRKTIGPYPGGKSDKKKHQPLYNQTSNKINHLTDGFCGLVNYYLVLSDQVNTAWLNDNDPEIYALLACIKNKKQLERLIKKIGQLNPVKRDDYYTWKKKKPTTQLNMAIRKLVILNCSVNSAGGGYSYEKAHRKWYINKPKIWREISTLFNHAKIKITNKDYKDILTTNLKTDLIYLDPPYYDVAQKGKLYGDGHNTIDFNELKEILDTITTRWILSNRDAPEMRKLFKQYHQLAYNTYNDMNNTRNKNPELIVSNYPLK